MAEAAQEMKLRGYAFYKAIGSPSRIVAPMVDQSELAFRMLSRRYGGQLCYTPMFHSRLFAESEDYRNKMMEVHAQDRPLVVQFCGNDPQTMLAAAKHVESQCDAVDLNLGCPQGIARKGRYGSFLMKEKDVVREIVKLLSQELSVPVTVKIRVFPDRQETLEFCDMLQEAGCDLLTVHGRTKEMNKTAVREVDLDIIREIKSRLQIPVILNGGIETYDDIEMSLKRTGADGVMSSEAILENPALFSGKNPIYDSDVSYLSMAREYLDLSDEFPPYTNKIVRAHLFKILAQDLAKHSDLRPQLAQSSSVLEMKDVVDELENRQDPPTYSLENSWYRRHRKARQLEEEKDAYEHVLDTGFGALFN